MYQATNVNLSQFTSSTTTTTTTTTLNTPPPPPPPPSQPPQPTSYGQQFTFNNSNLAKQEPQLTPSNNGFYQQPAIYGHTNQLNTATVSPFDTSCFKQPINNNNIYDNQDTQDRDDSIAFALDELGAIINSRVFESSSADQRQPTEDTTSQQSSIQEQQAVYGREQSNNFQETEASIYETLRNLISIEDNNNDTSSPASTATCSPTQQLVGPSENTTMSNRRNISLVNKTNFNIFGSHLGGQPNDMDHNDKTKQQQQQQPYVEIVEQPSKCALRFRYKCEGRSAGSLPGANATADNKTFPSIKIANYVGKAVVVVSCVTKDAPYRAHPHNIVGKEGCKKGICTIVLNNELDMVRSFSSLGIQCVKRKDIEESLALRESINVDPFRNGFAHKTCTSNIDLNVVRLCFQVFIEGTTPNKCDVPLLPVVSDPIHDKKAMSDLVITKLSHCSAPATGGREVILLCDRIAKDDIQIRFFEEREGKLIWETFTDLAPTDVHKQVAICFKTPKYFNENITQPVMARIQLRRISDNQVSEARHFQFLPCESDEDIISRKRQKIEWVNMNHYALDNILQPSQSHHHPHLHHHHHHLQHQHQAHQSQSMNQHAQHQQQPQQQRQHSPVMAQHNNQQPVQSQLSPHPQLQQPPPVSPQQQQQQQHHHHNQQQPDQHLGSSLDKIDTAELIRDIAFNSNMDMNLCSGLSLHLNNPTSSSSTNAHNHPNHLQQLDQQQQQQLAGSKCANLNINNRDKDC